MSALSQYYRIIAGETGAWSLPIRAVLRVLEQGYAAGVALRNQRYDRKGPTVTLPLPVISIGNITAGGTGKTPLVIDLAQRLERMGMNPAVVSRGYGSVDGGPNDEERLIREHCPGLVCLSDPDRAQAAEDAHRQFGADVIILDDGFQHRRLARTLDIVTVDATRPFGHGHLLPRGLLREPVSSLRRADVMVITRCDQASKAELNNLDARLERIAPSVPRLRSRHGVTGIHHLDGTPFTRPLAGLKAAAFAAIGHPESFVTLVRSLEIDVVARRWWPDHHHYRPADIDSLFKTGAAPPHEFLITTEKDAVKLTDLPGLDPARILVVKIAIDFPTGDATILDERLQEIFQMAD